MSVDRPPAPTLRDLIDLESQLATDAETPPRELRQRDRAIGQELAEAGVDGRRPLILAWLDRVRAGRDDLPGEQATRALRVVGLLLAILGILLGVGTASGTFAYDGHHPVNVIRVLVVFVGLQIGLLLLLAVAVAPSRWAARIPGALGVQESLRLLSPGRWTPLLARVLPHRTRTSLAALHGKATQFDQLYGRVRLWWVIRLAQTFAIAFHVGAALCALALVTFTDLAFGWSTTLEVGPAGFHSLTEWLAAPWSWWITDGVPTRELVEVTRYFRFETTLPGSGELDAETIALSGAWWRFLVAAMVVYGLLPRLVLAGLAGARLRATLAAQAFDHAACDRLYERLTETLLETRSPQRGENSQSRDAPITAPERELPPHGMVFGLTWSGLAHEPAVIASALEEFGRGLAKHASVGGSDVSADEAAFRAMSQHEADEVWLFTPSWEPPTRDVENFVRRLREHLGKSVTIAVVPVEVDANALHPAKLEDLKAWSRRLLAIGDPWLRIEPLTPAEIDGTEGAS